MRFLDTLKTAGGVVAVKAKKSAPTICVGVGIVSLIGSTVTAVLKARKLDEILEEHKEETTRLKNAHYGYTEEDGTEVPANEKYTKGKYIFDRVMSTLETGVKIAKAFIVPISLGILGITLISTGYAAKAKEAVSMTAAYMAMAAQNERLERRIIEVDGVEKLNEYKYGIKATESEILDEDGEPTGETAKVTEYEAQALDAYDFVWTSGMGDFNDNSPVANKDLAEYKIPAMVNMSLPFKRFTSMNDIRRLFDRDGERLNLPVWMQSVGYPYDPDDPQPLKISVTEVPDSTREGKSAPDLYIRFESLPTPMMEIKARKEEVDI